MIDRRRLMGAGLPTGPRRLRTPRRFIIQSAVTSEVQGFHDTDETPNYDEAREAVNLIAGIFAPTPAPMAKPA